MPTAQCGFIHFHAHCAVQIPFLWDLCFGPQMSSVCLFTHSCLRSPLFLPPPFLPFTFLWGNPHPHAHFAALQHTGFRPTECPLQVSSSPLPCSLRRLILSSWYLLFPPFQHGLHGCQRTIYRDGSEFSTQASVSVHPFLFCLQSCFLSFLDPTVNLSLVPPLLFLHRQSSWRNIQISSSGLFLGHMTFPSTNHYATHKRYPLTVKSNILLQLHPLLCPSLPGDRRLI